MATYLILNVIFLTLLLVWYMFQKRRGQIWQFTAVTLVVLVLFTAVFDSLIVALNIVDYNYAKTLGVMIGAAPIEDFFYALVAGILIPALWYRGGNKDDDTKR